MPDLDQSGRGFQKARVYLGPSLGWSDEQVAPSISIITGGSYTVQPGDSVLLINVAATVTVLLPNVASWIKQTANQPATGFGRGIWIKDLGSHAAAFNITITPFGTQQIDLATGNLVMNQNKQIVRLYPLIDLSGWFSG